MKPWALISAVAITYAIAGKLALLLAIPPGYSTAIWPAAGLALASVLLFGSRAVLGVFIGSFLANISISWDPSTTSSLIKSILLALELAAGAALQAWIGSYLIRRFVNFPSDMSQEKDVIKFVAWGGIIGCTISSSSGTLCLLANHLISTADVSFTWFNWWVGDVIGVMIFAPVVLLTAADSKTVSLDRKLSVSLPLITMFAAVVLFFLFFRAQETNNLQVEFDQRTDRQIQELQKKFENYLNTLYATQSFFAGSSKVDEQEFHAFTHNLLIRNPGIQGLSWNAYVADKDRDTFEKEIQQQNRSDFQILDWKENGQGVSASHRPEYVVITYMEPNKSNAKALGFDIMTIPDRRKALIRARDTGSPSATSRLRLIQEVENQFGFVVFLPVYKNGLSHVSISERRKNLEGFVAAVFRINDVVNIALQHTDREGIEMSIIDESAVGSDKIFYPQSSPNKLDETGYLSRDIPIEIAGRRWIAHFTLSPTYLVKHKSFQAWSFLLGAMLFTGLFGVLLLIMTGRTSMVEKLVKVRTLALQKVNVALRDEIAERKQAERQALEALQIKSDFTSMVSHELRTPLTAVKESVEIVQDGTAGPISDEQKTFLETAIRNVERLARLINDVLDFQKLTSGNQFAEMQMTENDLNEVVTNTANDFHLLAKKNGLEIVLQLSKDIPPLQFDRDKITQVLTNLLSNALKFTDKGKIIITTQKFQNLVRTSVQDQGIGVKEEDVSRLFQVFSQIDTGVSRKTGSTGLGLAISKQIIEAHQGTIGVESVFSKGSIFYFTLPINPN